MEVQFFQSRPKTRRPFTPIVGTAHQIPIMERVMTKEKPLLFYSHIKLDDEEYRSYCEALLDCASYLPKEITINGKLTNSTKSSILKAMWGE